MSRTAVLVSRLAFVAAAFACLSGMLILIGWGAGIDILKNPWRELLPITASRGLCMVLSGLALILLARQPQTPRITWIVRGFAGILCVFGILIMWDWVAMAIPGNPSIIPWDPPDALFGLIGGRTSFRGALATVLVGLGLFCASARNERIQQFSQAAAAMVALLAVTVFLGHTYCLPVLVKFEPWQGMKWFVALNFLAVATALFFSRPSSGPAALFLSPRMGGRVARRLLPLWLLVPLLGLPGHLWKHSASFDLLIIVLIVNLTLPFLIWLVAASLEKIDEQRESVQGEGEKAYEQILIQSDQLSRRMTELLVAQRQSSEAMQARSEFLAHISHELRTPLSGVLGSIGVLLDTPQPDEPRELLAIAQFSALSLVGLIDNILDCANLGAHKIALDEIDCDLPELLKSAVQAVRPEAENKHLSLQVSVAHSVPHMLQGDPGRLRQVLASLLDNAVKFTHRGTVEVQVDLCVMSNGQEGIYFGVRDTGIGIAETDLPRLFQPFVQLDSSVTRRYGGAGLGLALCKNLVELMHGEVGATSTPGVGSTFWIQVPVKSSANLVATDTGAGARTPASATLWKPVLLVDDTSTNARVIALFIEKLGYQVDVRAVGREVIEGAAQKVYALVLLDAKLPGMEGLLLSAAPLFELSNQLNQVELSTEAVAYPVRRIRGCG
jgi:signal transduction histidine kinase